MLPEAPILPESPPDDATRGSSRRAGAVEGGRVVVRRAVGLWGCGSVGLWVGRAGAEIDCRDPAHVPDSGEFADGGSRHPDAGCRRPGPGHRRRHQGLRRRRLGSPASVGCRHGPQPRHQHRPRRRRRCRRATFCWPRSSRASTRCAPSVRAFAVAGRNRLRVQVGDVIEVTFRAANRAARADDHPSKPQPAAGQPLADGGLDGHRAAGDRGAAARRPAVHRACGACRRRDDGRPGQSGGRDLRVVGYWPASPSPTT